MPRLGMAAIGAVVVVLRLIVGFVPPMVAVGRVVEWLVQRGAKQIGLLPLEAASAL